MFQDWKPQTINKSKKGNQYKQNPDKAIAKAIQSGSEFDAVKKGYNK